MILSGSVASLAALDRAESSARIPGVRSVNIQQVEIVSRPLHQHLADDPFALRPDPHVKSAIKDALRLDPRLDRSFIQVLVEAGSVQLHGHAPNLVAKNAAGDAAWHTSGVLEVDNQLIVRTPTRRSDAKLRRDVLTAISIDSLLAREGIQVTVNEGIVALKGTVSSPSIKQIASQVASQVSGVTTVRNELVVQPFLTGPPVTEVT